MNTRQRILAPLALILTTAAALACDGTDDGVTVDHDQLAEQVAEHAGLDDYQVCQSSADPGSEDACPPDLSEAEPLADPSQNLVSSEEDDDQPAYVDCGGDCCIFYSHTGGGSTKCCTGMGCW